MRAGPSGLVVGGFAAHVFVDDLEGEGPLGVAEDDAHHLFRVRRLRPGERVSAGDGAGRWRPCEVVEGSGVGAPQLIPSGPVVREARPHPAITVGFAVVKGEKPEAVVAKLTEAGVDRILPLMTDRGVVRWSSAEAPRRVAKLRRVAREAAMQSRRAWLPEVTEVMGLEEAVSAAGVAAGVALASMDGEAPSLACPALLIGPEGGWSMAELSRPLPHVAIGEHVYRSETAAVAGAAILAALRAAMVAEPRQRA